jgi:hypothetical protein
MNTNIYTGSITYVLIFCFTQISRVIEIKTSVILPVYIFLLIFLFLYFKF